MLVTPVDMTWRTETADDPNQKYVTDKRCVLCEVGRKILYVIQIPSLVKVLNCRYFPLRHIPCNSNIVKWKVYVVKHNYVN